MNRSGDYVEPSLIFTNRETHERFRAKFLREGSTYGRTVVWPHRDPGINIDNLHPDYDHSTELSGQFYLKALSEGPRRRIYLNGRKSSALWISPENHDEVVRWAEIELDKPWQAPSVVLPPTMNQSHAILDLADAGSRRATIYSSEFAHGLFGIIPVECKWVAVFREQQAQYANGLRVVYVPRNGRRHRILEALPPHDLVVLLGWGHPAMVSFGRYEEPSAGRKFGAVSFTMFQGHKQHDEFEENFSIYVRKPAVHVLLDLRGELPIDRKGREEDAGRTPVLLPDGRVLRNNARSNSRGEIEIAFPNAPSVFVSYHHKGDAQLRDAFERQLAGAVRSSSIFPGEIEAPASEAVAKRIMRERIGNCDSLVVLVGQQTYGRRWVDWEIRAALDSRIAGGPKPLAGVLSPALSQHFDEIVAAIEPVKGRIHENRVTAESDSLNATFFTYWKMRLPARLLDNLISGYATLHAWPRSTAGLESMLLPRVDADSLAITGRASMPSDLNLG